MRTVTYLIGISAMVLISGCRKDYVCECTTDGVNTKYDFTNVKKDEAIDMCDDVQQWNFPNGTCVVE